MLDHVSITVFDLVKAERFYDAILAELGVVKVGSDHAESWIGYGERCDEKFPNRNYLSIRQGSTPGDAPSRHWCFRAKTRAEVDAFWRAGLENGGTDNGKPGVREYHPSYYAAFLVDQEGNRIEAVCHTKLQK